jgi:hypothetical protein
LLYPSANEENQTLLIKPTLRHINFKFQPKKKRIQNNINNFRRISIDKHTNKNINIEYLPSSVELLTSNRVMYTSLRYSHNINNHYE